MAAIQQVSPTIKYLHRLIIFHFRQPPVRTRRSNGSTDDATLSGALKCFSSTTSTKSIVKKIGIEVIQLLLAHAFKVIFFVFQTISGNLFK